MDVRSAVDVINAISSKYDHIILESGVDGGEWEQNVENKLRPVLHYYFIKEQRIWATLVGDCELVWKIVDKSGRLGQENKASTTCMWINDKEACFQLQWKDWGDFVADVGAKQEHIFGIRHKLTKKVWMAKDNVGILLQFAIPNQNIEGLEANVDWGLNWADKTIRHFAKDGQRLWMIPNASGDVQKIIVKVRTEELAAMVLKCLGEGFAEKIKPLSIPLALKELFVAQCAELRIFDANHLFTGVMRRSDKTRAREPRVYYFGFDLGDIKDKDLRGSLIEQANKYYENLASNWPDPLETKPRRKKK